MPAPSFTLTREVVADGTVRVHLAGSLLLQDGASLWRQMQAAVPSTGDVAVDVAGVDRLDGGAAALLTAIAGRLAVGGGRLTFHGASGDTARQLELYDCARGGDCDRAQAPTTPGLLA
jgi:ABC-type transporter Mla MlaB component